MAVVKGEDEVVEDEAAEDEAAEEAAAAEARAQLDAAAKLKPVVEPERQLSKKELKKKELEDMDAVLAELGIDVAVVRNRGWGALNGCTRRPPCVQDRRRVCGNAPRRACACNRAEPRLTAAITSRTLVLPATGWEGGRFRRRGGCREQDGAEEAEEAAGACVAVGIHHSGAHSCTLC
jgi:hypothetical protein